jgi:hypothetical protein
MQDFEIVWNGAHEERDRDLLDASLRVGSKRYAPYDEPRVTAPRAPIVEYAGLSYGGISVAIERFIETTLHEQFLRRLYRGTENRFSSDVAAGLSCGRCQVSLRGSDIFTGARTRYGLMRLCARCDTHRRQRREQFSSWLSTHVAKRKARGTCVTCGQRPARPDRVACAQCAATQKAAKKKQRDKQRHHPMETPCR